MKKTISIVLSLIMILGVCLSLTACGGKTSSKPTIGIIQFGSHDSLNNCYEGIKKGLAEQINLDDYNIEYVNSNFSALLAENDVSAVCLKMS